MPITVRPEGCSAPYRRLAAASCKPHVKTHRLSDCSVGLACPPVLNFGNVPDNVPVNVMSPIMSWLIWAVCKTHEDTRIYWFPFFFLKKKRREGGVFSKLTSFEAENTRDRKWTRRLSSSSPLLLFSSPLLVFSFSFSSSFFSLLSVSQISGKYRETAEFC